MSDGTVDELAALIERANRLLDAGLDIGTTDRGDLRRDLRRLMEAKVLVRRLNVVCHGVACALALHELRRLHPEVHRWIVVPGAGAGRDVEGRASDGDRLVAAEVKATLLSLGDRPGADQLKNWRSDVRRLQEDAAPAKYFAVPSAEAANAARAICPPGVNVIDLDQLSP